MKPKPVVRVFNGTDAYMVQTARVTYGFINGDLAKFTAFDTTIKAPLLATFLANIVSADTVVADSAVIDQLSQTTENVVATMETARAKYAEVKYFASKAFPTSQATQNEFGLNDYDGVRKNDSKMIQFLDEMHKACVKYQTQLITAGYTAAGIAAIQTIRTDLQNKNTTQETFKKQRPKLTEDRIIVLNNCYNMMVQLNAAAQIVYAADYAKQKQFVYNPSAETAGIEFSGVVAAGHSVTAGTIEFSDEKVFMFKNTGLAPLVFCLSASDVFEGIQVSLGGGAIITKLATELNPDATNLLVKNTDVNVEGSYEIEIDE